MSTSNLGTTNNLSRFEDAVTSRWLTETLAPARARLRDTPNAETIERIRMRVIGVPAGRKTDRVIAA